MTATGPVRFLTEIDHEVLVDLHAAVFRVAVDHHHDPALGADFRIELVVPNAVKRTGDIKSLSIAAELQQRGLGLNVFAALAQHPGLALNPFRDADRFGQKDVVETVIGEMPSIPSLSGLPEDRTSTDFVRERVQHDLDDGVFDRVQTRFPPEPNGYLHIGHAKSICLNFGIAAEFGGTTNLRFDDTNPTKEDVEYVDSIKADIKWLGFDWEDREYYASDYFGKLYDFAIDLIKRDLAYVDDQSSEEWPARKEHPPRLVPTVPFEIGPWRKTWTFSKG